MSLNQHYLTFAGTWEPDRKLFEKGDYLAALAKSKRLERMVVILRVHDILCRSNHPLIECGDPKADAPAHPLPDVAYAQSLGMWTQTIGLNPGPNPLESTGTGPGDCEGSSGP